MLCLMGKTASGKDLVCSKLVNNYGYKKIVAYTTRPIRNSEVDGITYNYITPEEFLKKINNNFFAEWKKYITNDGEWYYGTARKDYECARKNTVVILPPSSIEKLKNKYDIKVIYIYTNIDTMYKRLIKRKDDKLEAERRVEADIRDFKHAEHLSDKIIYNNYHEDRINTINGIVEAINVWYMELIK